MPPRRVSSTLSEDKEWVSSYDLIEAAHQLMGGIELDVASSKFANEYVGADNFFTPSDDGLNCQEWFGSAYLFPPSGAYFWDKKTDRWKKTRSSAITLKSCHAVWFNKMYRAWLADEIKQGLYFSNCPDMFRYEQKLFDFPVCILKSPPLLVKRTSEGVTNHRTCTSFIVYFQPKDNPGAATEKFIDIYSHKGRILY